MSENEVDYKKVGQAFREVTGITPQPDGKTITDTDRLWFLLNMADEKANFTPEQRQYVESESDFEKLMGFREYLDQISQGSLYRKAPKHPDCERWGFANKENAQ